MKDYYKLQKFNVMEIANAKNLRDEGAEGRVADKTKDAPTSSPVGGAGNEEKP